MRLPRRFADHAPDADPVQVIYSSENLRVGSFRCPAGHARWRTENHAGEQALMVFGRTTVGIRQQHMPAVLADPTHVMFYNPSVSYTRELADSRGDQCEWFGMAPPIMIDAIAEFDPAVRDRHERPLTFPSGPCSSFLFLHLRRLVELVRRERDIDHLRVEESFLELLRAALDAVFQQHSMDRVRKRPRTKSCDTMQAHRELAARTRIVIARTYHQRLTLGDLSRQVFASPHHLCRVFREESSMSIHQLITELRLRESLDHLADRNVDFTRLALDLGFASHAHFSTSFKRMFGVTPSQARTQLRQR